MVWRIICPPCQHPHLLEQVVADLEPVPVNQISQNQFCALRRIQTKLIESGAVVKELIRNKQSDGEVSQRDLVEEVIDLNRHEFGLKHATS